jgi:hypothetical protein
MEMKYSRNGVLDNDLQRRRICQILVPVVKDVVPPHVLKTVQCTYNGTHIMIY